jgi:peptide/nickel transport system permease protein
VSRLTRRLRRDPAALIGLALLLALLVVAIGAPWFYPGDPQDRVGRALIWPFEDSSLPLGTDRLGRDLAAGLAHGARVSLAIGFTAAAAAVAIGVLVGGLAGYLGGWVEDLLMRIADAVQTVPGFVLALALVAVLGPGVGTVVLAIAITSWTATARVVRAEVSSWRERDLVLACRAMGMGHGEILFRQILPNIASPVIVLASVVVAVAILVESALSFLGLGDPNLISWGGMIAEGRGLLRRAWYVAAVPGAAIILAVVAVSLAGEALTAALDPRDRL